VPQIVAGALARFFTATSIPILFLGAGVSVRSGLPDWKRLVEQLAEGLRSSDPLRKLCTGVVN
jgi:hypothetical protein